MERKLLEKVEKYLEKMKDMGQLYADGILILNECKKSLSTPMERKELRDKIADKIMAWIEDTEDTGVYSLADKILALSTPTLSRDYVRLTIRKTLIDNEWNDIINAEKLTQDLTNALVGRVEYPCCNTSHKKGEKCPIHEPLPPQKEIDLEKEIANIYGIMGRLWISIGELNALIKEG